MGGRYDLTDFEWSVIAPLLPEGLRRTIEWWVNEGRSAAAASTVENEAPPVKEAS